MPQEDGEEDEDIDTLVNFHKKTLVSSTSSLRGSQVKYLEPEQLTLDL